MNNLWQFRKFFLYSLFLHLCLVVVLFFGFYKLSFDKQQTMGNKNDQIIINTYLYKSKSAKLKKTVNKKNKSSKLNNNIVRHKNLNLKSGIIKTKIKNKIGIISNANKFTIKRSDATSVAEQKNNPYGKQDKLLIMLHNLIEQHIQYPHGVLIGNSRPQMQLGFTLYPDGHITNIMVLQSSGIKILDKSAMNTLYSLQPVKGVGFYLKQEKYFFVIIIFQI